MKRLFSSLVFSICVATCFSQTQKAMNDDASKSYQVADSTLNAVYRKILLEYKEYTAFIHNLKKAQRIWVQLRDVELKAKYPDIEIGIYGSAYPLWCICTSTN